MYISAGNPGNLLVAGTTNQAVAQKRKNQKDKNKSAAIETQNKLKVANGDGQLSTWTKL